MQKGGDGVARQCVYFAYFFYFVPPKFHTDSVFGVGGGEYFQNVATHTECATVKVHVVALVLYGNEFFYYRLTGNVVAGSKRKTHFVVFAGSTQTIDAGNACHHDCVTSFKQTASGGMAQFINLVVDVYFLFDVQISGRNVTFRHVVVVVGNKKFHSVFGEKLTKFVAQLRRKRFVVANYQRRTVYVGNDVCHCKGFSAARYAT